MSKTTSDTPTVQDTFRTVVSTMEAMRKKKEKKKSTIGKPQNKNERASS